MKELQYVRAISEALDEEMARDDAIFIVGEDVGAAGGVFTETRGLFEKYGPRRLRDTPISEAAVMGLALGAAMSGLRPIIDIMFIDFVTVCMDPLVNHMAKARYMFGGQYTIPAVILAADGAGVASGPHHSQSLAAWFTHVPGLKVVSPSNPADIKGLLKSSIRDDNPVVFIYHKAMIGTKGPAPEGEYTIPLGKADVKRAGTDVTVVAISSMVHESLIAADTLAKEGVSVEVVDPRTLYPLDLDTIVASVQKTSRLVIVHEEVKQGGVGAEISAQVAEHAIDYLDAPIIRVGAPFVPIPFSPYLERAYIPKSGDIVAAIQRTLR